MNKKGIDVSAWQRAIDWEAVKEDGIEFAILRCGMGDNIESQDDKYFIYNASECSRLGIPVGIYLYSYATNEKQKQSEIEHVLRLLKIVAPEYPVFLDVEDKTQISLGREWITDMCVNFCQAISNAGYKAGIYANQNWLTNYIDTSRLNDYEIWIANYGNNDGSLHELNYNGQYQIHQYTSAGQVNGINGRVDMNMCYYDYCTNAPSNNDNAEEQHEEQYSAGSYKTICRLNVRTEPNTSSKIVTTLGVGSRQGVDYTNGNWGHLMNDAGWICLDYCEPIEIIADTYRVTATKLNVRNGAGMNYSVIDTALNNVLVTVYEQDGDWSRIDEGWVCNKYLEKV